MAVSEYGREGGKAFKYTEIQDSEVHVDNLFGDIVDHWIRYRSWDQENDEIYPDDETLFHGVRDDMEIRLRQVSEDSIKIEYGLETSVDNSLAYVNSVWGDEIKTILERNSEEDITDHHIVDRTLDNLFTNNQEAEV